MIWKPVAIAALFAGAAGHRAALPRAAPTTAASPSSSRCSPARRSPRWSDGRGWGGDETKLDFDFIGGELWTGSYVWGYLFTGVAVGLLPLSLLAYERGPGRRSAARCWPGPRPAGCCAPGCSPGRASPSRWSSRRPKRCRGAATAGRSAAAGRDAAPVLAGDRAAARLLPGPLAHRPILGAGRRHQRHPALAVVGHACSGSPRWRSRRPSPTRLPAPDFGALALRAWPLAGLVVFYQPAGTFPFHAFQGLTLPLAVLGVAGAAGRGSGSGRCRCGRPWRSSPSWSFPERPTASTSSAARCRSAVRPSSSSPGSATRCAGWSARRRRGGVLTTVYSGVIDPGLHRPRDVDRRRIVDPGRRPPRAADRRPVRRPGRPGGGRADRARVRRPLRLRGLPRPRRPDAARSRAVAGPPRRFGCATVYEVRGA